MKKIYYTKFGNTPLPTYNRKDDISAPEAKSGVIETAGGYMDGYSGDAPLSAKQITVECDIANSNIFSLEATLSTWRAKVGMKDKLYRFFYTDGEQYAYARLMSIQAETSYEASPHVCHITLAFELLSPCWYGEIKTITYNETVRLDWPGYTYIIPYDDFISGSGIITDIQMDLSFSQTMEPRGITIACWENTSGSTYNRVSYIEIAKEIPAGAQLHFDFGKKQAYCTTTEGGVQTKTNLYPYIDVSYYLLPSWFLFVGGKRNRIRLRIAGENAPCTIDMTVKYAEIYR